MHCYHINIEEWGDRKSTKERRGELPSSTSVYLTPWRISYLTWEFYGNTTIMLSNEPLLGQLNSLHMSGIGIASCALIWRRSSEVHIRVCCCTNEIYIHVLYIWLFLTALPDVRLSVSVRALSVPIFERCARHVCLAAVNNSLDVGIAALLWRNILSTSAMWQYLHV